MKKSEGAQKEIKTGQIWKFYRGDVFILILKLEPETEHYYERAYCYYSFINKDLILKSGTYYHTTNDILEGYSFLC